MTFGRPRSFGAQLKALREAAGYTQEELATIAGLSVRAVSALERGERRRPHVETADTTAVDELSGVGKTRLALEVAHAIAAEGANRVVFVPLAAIRTPILVASAIGEALGLSSVTARSAEARTRRVRRSPHSAGARHFEQVIDAAPLVAELLTSVIVVRLLVTSRAPLHVRGEREYVVGPLAMEVGSDALSPPDLARAAAVRLFLEQVRERSSRGVMVPCPRARTRWARSPA